MEVLLFLIKNTCGMVFSGSFIKVTLWLRLSIGELSLSLQNDLALEPSIIDIYGGL